MLGKTVLLTLLIPISLGSEVRAQRQAEKPQINKIYFLQDASSSGSGRVFFYLFYELMPKGVMVVDRVEDADAILSGIVAEEVVLFDPRPKWVADLEPKETKVRYEFELKTRDLKKLWQTDFEIKGESEGNADKKAARKIAKGIDRFRQKAKK